MEPLPPQISIQTFAPQPSFDLGLDEASPAPTDVIYPWDRKIQIVGATLYEGILNIYTKPANIEQSF